MEKTSFEELKNEFTRKKDTFTHEEIIELACYGYLSVKQDAKTLGVGEGQ